MKSNKVYIIAEIGVNHNGDIKLAKELISDCKKAGADAVKFQTYTSDKICHTDTKKANYQRKSKSNQSQLEMLRKYELSHKNFIELYNFSKTKKIDFITTISDISDINFITKDLKLNSIKVGSSDLTNIQLLIHLGRTGRRILLSSGMSTISEIDTALSALAFGNKNKSFNFNIRKHNKYYQKHQKYIKNKIVLLHCTTEYPAPMNELNLNILETFRNIYDMQIGYSDHSNNFLTPIMAVSKNIKYIEVHVTKSNRLQGPDHSSSLNIKDFNKYVQLIKKAEIILGNSIKKLTPSEKKNYKHVTKRLFLRKNIRSGQILKDEYIACKRSNSGLLASEYSKVINRKVKTNISKDSKILLKDLN